MNKSGSTNTSVLVSENKKWLEALYFCREKHTDLIAGPQLQQLPNNWYWIGLFRDSWVWSDGNSSSFRNWDVSETVLSNGWNPNTPQCARLSEQKRWKSEDCNQKRPFICYGDHVILIKQNLSFEDALVYCRRNHRDLAVMSHRQLQRMVRERAKKADTPMVWVGLFFVCFFEEWFWVDGNFVYDSKWNDGKEPRECNLAGAVKSDGTNNKWFGEHMSKKSTAGTSILTQKF
ncbi:hypothetical protein WMY93_030674 [Mugilogobius chulae]|uniref:C-type lectin domain-containing protein n=1 Tax=Mugilogobius chulae TaxID=88201 RepID=A0AAW0MJU1_9GOBI